jgi:hypothetical protein
LVNRLVNGIEPARELMRELVRGLSNGSAPMREGKET